MTTRSILLALAALVTATGCYDAPRPNCAFLCTGNTACPDGYTCAADGWCKRDDVAPTFACETVTVDAAVADATDTCTGATLAAMATCSFHVRFAPDAVAAFTGVAGVSATTGGAASINLTGAGTSALTAPSPLAFGGITVNGMSDLPVTFTNGGGATTGALTTARSGDAQFSIQADTCNAATVAPAGTCTVTVRFAPIATGAVTGTLTVTGDPGGPVAVQLTGTGQ